MIDSLTKLLDQPPPVISILDIGAAPLEGHPEIYAPLLKTGRAIVTGFEPDPDSCDQLNRKFGPINNYLPYIIFDGGRRTFHVTNTGLTSSIYQPDHELRRRFHQLSDVAQVIRSEEVDTHRLDDLEELRDGVDFIKADAQGAEYEIFRNGPRVVKSACVVHTEAHLIPVYKNQPLLADQDRVLREYGFQFHQFVSPFGRPFKPFFNKANPAQPLSQLTQVDVIYARDFMRLDSLEPEKLLKMAIILHEVYHSVDLCHAVLSAYDRACATEIAKRYHDELVSDPESGIGSAQ